MFQDFINCFTMPNKDGGIFLNVHHNFGIMNKLQEWYRKKEHAGKYEIKTPKKKNHYE